LLAHVAEMSRYFGERLSRMDFGKPPSLRIRGLAVGVEVESEEYGDKASI
jgi:hypothetical protein